MRAVFLNQRDLLIMRGARCTLPHGSARKLGGLATVALVFAKAAGARIAVSSGCGAQRLEVIASGSRRRIMLLQVGFRDII